MTSRPPLPRVDAAPLKDVARSLRFVAERGSQTLKNALPLDALPDPAARVAERALSALLKAGHDAERGMSALAHALLDRNDPPPAFSHLEAESEQRFAFAAHAGLRAALAHLGADNSLVSETAARRAWQSVAASRAGANDSETAAALFGSLLQTQTLREVVWPENQTLQPAEAARIATFAVLLAMLADPAQFRDLIAASCDLALALRNDLAAEDPARLASLFEEFRDHV